MQLLGADAKVFSKKCFFFFAPKKLKKPTLKSCSENSNTYIFFPYCIELPKQKNSCSKMWLIDQLKDY